MLASLLCACVIFSQAQAGEPVTFEFKRKSGPAQGRKEAFDAKTQTYFLHIHDIARFEIKAVAPDLEKRRVVLHITGMLDKPEGPLSFTSPKTGAKTRNSNYTTRALTKSFAASAARTA